MLRQEVYADCDGRRRDSERAHPVHRHRAELHRPRLQPRGANRHAVFFTHAARGDQLPLRAQPGRPAHPARADAGGRRLRQRAQAGRHRLRAPRSPRSDAGCSCRPDWPIRRPSRRTTLLTYTENRVTNADRRRADALPHPAAVRGAHLRADRLHADRPGRPLPGRRTSSSPTRSARPPAPQVHRTEVAYEADRRRQPAPPPDRAAAHALPPRRPDRPAAARASCESLALPGESYKLAFTPGLLDAGLPASAHGQPPSRCCPTRQPCSAARRRPRRLPASQALKADGRFPATDADDHWWIPSGRIVLHPEPADNAAHRARAGAAALLPAAPLPRPVRPATPSSTSTPTTC